MFSCDSSTPVQMCVYVCVCVLVLVYVCVDSYQTALNFQTPYTHPLTVNPDINLQTQPDTCVHSSVLALIF